MNKIFKDIHLIIILNGGSSIIIPNAWFEEHRKRTVLRQENNHIAVLRNLQKKGMNATNKVPFMLSALFIQFRSRKVTM